MPLRLIFLCFRRQWVFSYVLYGFRTLFCVDRHLENKRNSALGSGMAYESCRSCFCQLFQRNKAHGA